MSKRKNLGLRIQADEHGLDELVISGLVHIEAMGTHSYFVVLGNGPSSRRFNVTWSRNKDGFIITDQDAF